MGIHCAHPAAREHGHLSADEGAVAGAGAVEEVRIGRLHPPIGHVDPRPARWEPNRHDICWRVMMLARHDDSRRQVDGQYDRATAAKRQDRDVKCRMAAVAAVRSPADSNHEVVLPCGAVTRDLDLKD